MQKSFFLAIIFVCLMGESNGQDYFTDCSKAAFPFINNQNIDQCNFFYSDIDNTQVEKVEFGNKVDVNDPNYHCYYTETKICDTADCKECNKENIFKLMISSRQNTAPTFDNSPSVNCGVVKLIPSNPIIQTVHPKQYSTFNITVKVYMKNGEILVHVFHPGRIQRTVFEKGEAIYIGTRGEGTGGEREGNVFMGREGLWQLVDWKIKSQLYLSHFSCLKSVATAILLFDVSGSMNENGKWEAAKQSALNMLKYLQEQAELLKFKLRISIRSFEGNCKDDPTKEVIGFTSDIAAVENAIKNKMPPPGGQTPLNQSIKVAEGKLNAYLAANKLKEGKLLLFTDGASTCGTMRPNNVYGYGQQNFQPANLNKTNSPKSPIQYCAIGFDIAPGSAAERDLQYFAQTKSGKYLNAQNQADLTFAFQKFNKIYIPKLEPTINLSNENDKFLFYEGLNFIIDENFEKAFENYKQYAGNNTKDYNGIYNFALASEANDKYKAAVQNYELYLKLNPTAKDKSLVTKTIKNLKDATVRFAEYNKHIVETDMSYLNAYFKKIQNGESVALAEEFTGFIKEKYDFYKNFAANMENDDRFFKITAKEVFKGLKQCAEMINKNPNTWDRDATPVLSRTYLNMEKLLSLF